jgi:hypothetical protein
VILQTTTAEYDRQTVTQGTELRATVVSTSDAASRTWVRVFTAGPRGEWQTLYGFTFSPKRDELFFTKTDASTGALSIAAEPRVSGALTYAPAVFFSWMPARGQNRYFAAGITGGLGATSGSASVFLGGNVTINQNLAVILGLTFQQQKRLLGKYEVGDVLKESLTTDQLTQDVYRPNYFFGVAFRFGASPFGSGSKDQKPKDDAKPTAAGKGE